VSEGSTREIENLIGEVRGLRETLKTDCDRIQGDLAGYAELRQGVTQLTANISDSASSFGAAPRRLITRRREAPSLRQEPPAPLPFAESISETGPKRDL